MKKGYLSIALAGAALLLIGCNQNVPPAPAEDTTTVVPVPVPGASYDVVIGPGLLDDLAEPGSPLDTVAVVAELVP